MRTLILFSLFLIGSLLLASLLAYPAVEFWQQAGADPWETTRWSKNIGKLIAMLLFLPLVIWLGMANRDALGIGGGWLTSSRNIGRGMLFGLGLMIPVAMVLILLDIRTPVEAELLGERLIKGLVSGLIGGLIIGVIEELYFRGAIWKHSRRSKALGATLLITGVYYAAVHFIRFKATETADNLPWYEGANELLNGLATYPQVFDISSFIALLSFGVLLGLLREYDGNIWRCIGTHAAVVMVIRVLKTSTQSNEAVSSAWLVGQYDHIIGWLAAGWFILIIIWLLAKHSSTQTK